MMRSAKNKFQEIAPHQKELVDRDIARNYMQKKKPQVAIPAFFLVRRTTANMSNLPGGRYVDAAYYASYFNSRAQGKKRKR